MAHYTVNDEYVDRLIVLSEDLKIASDKYFDTGEGSKARGQSRSDADVVMHGKIEYLIGFIDALRKE
jgi:hypothetical protein